MDSCCFGESTSWSPVTRKLTWLASASAIRFANSITYLRLRITNAGSESLNSKIQWVKYTLLAIYASKKNFVTAIYFHCGGFDLMPSTH